MTLHAPGDDAHTTVLQTLLVHLLTTADLTELCEDAGIADLADADGQPVHVTFVLTYEDAGVLSLDRGIVIELSDGARVACPLSLQARPHPGARLRTRTVQGVDLTMGGPGEKPGEPLVPTGTDRGDDGATQVGPAVEVGRRGEVTGGDPR